jgi:hypothetical protein
VYTNFFPFQNKPGHPRVKDHKQMAANLISFIDTHIKW